VAGATGVAAEAVPAAMKPILVVLLLASPAFAQEPTPLRWNEHSSVPSRISDAIVATQITADVIAAYRSDRRWNALGVELCRTAFVIGTTEVIKRLVKRERPNKADRFSFPSAHTAHAVAHSDYAQPWGASLALTVGWGRQAGGWHYATDVGIGALDGWLSTKVCR
jgi:membrane-associated phospholipid phosphatase